MARGRLRKYNKEVVQDGAHTCQLMHCHDHIPGSGWNSSRSSVFLKLTADQFMDSDHGLKHFHKLLEQAKKLELHF